MKLQRKPQQSATPGVGIDAVGSVGNQALGGNRLAQAICGTGIKRSKGRIVRPGMPAGQIREGHGMR